MPVLKNPRWERLAQELAQNKTATEAMQLAGYTDPRNSTRLTKRDEIRRRVEELQSRGAERAEVSIASLLAELENAREKATDLDQLSAAVRAIEAKAKVSGLLVQRVELGGPGDFDEVDCIEEAVDLILDCRVRPFRPVSEADRQGFIDLMERHAVEIGQYTAALNAKPIVSANPAQAKWDALVEARRLAAPRPNGNGNGRR